MYLWTAFTIGLLGSFHCIGMCGPIAMALPYSGPAGQSGTGNALLYNAGRICTYSLLGLIPGFIGHGLTLAGFQQGLSLFLGIFMLIAAIVSLPFERQIQNLAVVKNFQKWLQQKLGTFLKGDGRKRFFGIGILNGFLPCGLVYMGLAGALTQNYFWQGALYMAVFGLGTVPMMFLIGMSGQIVGAKTRNYLRRLVPAFMFVIALLLIVRGLALDLPGNLEEMISMGIIPMCK